MKEKTEKQSVKRRKYSPEFKDRALVRGETEGVFQVAKDLGMAASMLYSWRAKQRLSGQPHEIQKQQQAEMARLAREVKRLKEENSFLKKAATFFAKEQEPDT